MPSMVKFSGILHLGNDSLSFPGDGSRAEGPILGPGGTRPQGAVGAWRAPSPLAHSAREKWKSQKRLPGQGRWWEALSDIALFLGHPQTRSPPRRGGPVVGEGHAPDSGRPRAFILFN